MSPPRWGPMSGLAPKRLALNTPARPGVRANPLEQPRRPLMNTRPTARVNGLAKPAADPGTPNKSL